MPLAIFARLAGGGGGTYTEPPVSSCENAVAGTHKASTAHAAMAHAKMCR
jgi:hypothetical protein